MKTLLRAATGRGRKNFGNNGKRGQGVETNPDGSRYAGEWKDGIFYKMTDS